MLQQTIDSGFHARVHRGYVDKFTSKRRSAENRADRQKVLQSIEIAVTQKMIDQSEQNLLREYSKQRAQELKK